MLIRVLIVLLAILNLGVAWWWLMHPAGAIQSTPPALAQADSTIARLQLLREVPPSVLVKMPRAAQPQRASESTTENSVPPAPVATAPPRQRCFAMGPFADAQAVTQARALLQDQTVSLRTRQTSPSTTRSWRVWIPPRADRAAAQAMIERIKTAGFEDYFVVPSGGEANAIALGRYRSEGAARQRETELHAAGFSEVTVQPADAVAGQSWLDVTVTDPAFDLMRTRRKIGAAQADPIDCAKLR